MDDRGKSFHPPAKDTYAVECISNYPEYLAVRESGEITWFGFPQIQGSNAKPLVTAKLAFIDGQKLQYILDCMKH